MKFSLFFLILYRPFYLSGLRCLYSASCEAWDWTGEPADLDNPDIRVCTGDPGEEPCVKRTCGMIYDKDRASGTIRKSDTINNLYIGWKYCYEQITGQMNGCYKQDISYDSSRQSRVGEALAWGECALKCEEISSRPFGDCTFWTWASTSCSICEKGICYLHYTGNDNIEPDIRPNHHGHISGSRKCQDIGFRNNNVKPLESRIKSRFSNTEFPAGLCKSNCPAQEVPGFRYKDNFKVDISIRSAGGLLKEALLMTAQMMLRAKSVRTCACVCNWYVSGRLKSFIHCNL